jgi:hypothetical protein
LLLLEIVYAGRMTKLPHDYDKHIDLHTSEWRHEKKKEPFFGPGSFWFFNVTVPTAIIAIGTAYGVSWLLTAVTGYSPYR